MKFYVYQRCGSNHELIEFFSLSKDEAFRFMIADLEPIRKNLHCMQRSNSRYFSILEINLKPEEVVAHIFNELWDTDLFYILRFDEVEI